MLKGAPAQPPRVINRTYRIWSAKLRDKRCEKRSALSQAIVARDSLAGLLEKWLRQRSRALLPELLDATLMLLNLNLNPLAESLGSLYSGKSRGRPPLDHSLPSVRRILVANYNANHFNSDFSSRMPEI